MNEKYRVKDIFFWAFLIPKCCYYEKILIPQRKNLRNPMLTTCYNPCLLTEYNTSRRIFPYAWQSIILPWYVLRVRFALSSITIVEERFSLRVYEFLVNWETRIGEWNMEIQSKNHIPAILEAMCSVNFHFKFLRRSSYVYLALNLDASFFIK